MIIQKISSLYWPISKVVLGFCTGGFVTYFLLEKLRQFKPKTKRQNVLGFLIFYICFTCTCIIAFIYPLLALRSNYTKLAEAHLKAIVLEEDNA